MPRAAAIRQADVSRVLRALEAHGLGVGRVEILAGGRVVITPADLAPALTSSGDRVTQDPLDAWRARKRDANPD